MAKIIREWSPDPVTCGYCDTYFTWDADDVRYSSGIGYLIECPKCNCDIRLHDNKMPEIVRVAAKKKSNGLGRPLSAFSSRAK
jgi:hypothetical protein